MPIRHLLLCALAVTMLAAAEDPPAMIDATGFDAVTREAMEHRKDRLIAVERFAELASQPGTIILDARSTAAFERKHLAGAINLPFADFTADKLAAVIPDPDTTILIYCNNNILGNPPAFETKRAPLALNLPTFINLCGYGYREIYELADAVTLDDERLQFVGTDFESTTD